MSPAPFPTEWSAQPMLNTRFGVAVVPDFQLPCIGKEGQNARLAAKPTGWKIGHQE